MRMEDWEIQPLLTNRAESWSLSIFEGPTAMRLKLALALIALVAPVAAQAGSLMVPIDQSRRLPIGGSAANVVVGNTAIADVRAVDSHTLMVVGKKQGVTNVVVLDAGGRTLFDGEVAVVAPAGAMMTVFRGNVASEYACSPHCQATGAQAGGGFTPRASTGPSDEVQVTITPGS